MRDASSTRFCRSRPTPLSYSCPSTSRTRRQKPYPAASASAQAYSRRTRPWTSSAPSVSSPARTSTSSPSSTTAYANQGLPRLTHDTLATFEVRVDSTVDVGTHLVFIGTVEHAEVVGEGTPITYDYYHRVLRGKTSPAEQDLLQADGDDPAKDETIEVEEETAASEQKVAWRCRMCGYTVEGYRTASPRTGAAPCVARGATTSKRCSSSRLFQTRIGDSSSTGMCHRHIMCQLHTCRKGRSWVCSKARPPSSPVLGSRRSRMASAGSIGYGIATAFAKEGANLVITGRNVKKLEDGQGEAGGRIRHPGASRGRRRERRGRQPGRGAERHRPGHRRSSAASTRW